MRPFGVTLLSITVLLTSILYFSRFYEAVRDWDFMVMLLPFSPLYLVLSGLIWGLIGLSLFWGLWRGLFWAPRFTIAGLLAFLLYFWMDRLLMPAYPGRNSNGLFWLGVSIFLLGYCLLVLTRSKAKLFFGGVHE